MSNSSFVYLSIRNKKTVMSKNDLVAVMQMAVSLLDKGEAKKANGVLKIALTSEFNSGK